MTALNILDDISNYIEKVKESDNDKLNALIGKIFEHACSNDWTVEQAMNCALFNSFISNEMQVYLWNQISKCKRESNIIKYHKFVEKELLAILNTANSIK